MAEKLALVQQHATLIVKGQDMHSRRSLLVFDRKENVFRHLDSAGNLNDSVAKRFACAARPLLGCITLPFPGQKFAVLIPLLPSLQKSLQIDELLMQFDGTCEIGDS